MKSKKKGLTRNICLLSQKNFFPSLLNLGAQIGCAENRYTAVQIDLKPPVVHFIIKKFFDEKLM